MKPMRSRFFAAALGCLLLATPAFCQNILVKDGEKVAFLGDSITQFGFQQPMGYVNLVTTGLAANGINVKTVPAGISGNKSNDMLARVDRAVIAQAPQWMTLSCGVNDVWHGQRGAGISLEDYKTNIRAIVDKATAANIKVVILTATMIYEDPKNELNTKLIPYNDFLRELAKEKGFPLADLNADMQAQVAAQQAAGKKGNVLTGDGVHMILPGNIMMATGVLKAFGLNEDQLAKARTGWQLIVVPTPANITFGQSEQLQKLADVQKRSVADIMADLVTKYLAANPK